MASKITNRIQVALERRLPSFHGLFEFLFIVCREDVGWSRGIFTGHNLVILDVDYRLRAPVDFADENPARLRSPPSRDTEATHYIDIQTLDDAVIQPDHD